MKHINIRSYQAQFSCIGSDCEDPCCSGWNIPVSKRDRERLASVMHPEELNEFIQEHPIPQVRKSQRSCMKLCSKGLCSIQTSFGHSYLPDVCAPYPRFMGIHERGAEVGGWLSCPEIVRLSLEYSGSLLDTKTAIRAITDINIQQPAAAYEKSFFEVRDWFEQRFTKSTSAKEFFVQSAPLIGLSPAFFHKGSGDFAQLVQKCSMRSFVDGCTDEDQSLIRDSFLSCLRDFSARDWPYPKPMKLLERALHHFSDETMVIPSEWELRYIIHDWNVRWYVHSPNLLFHWQATLFKLLLIRLLYQVHTSNNEQAGFVEAVYSTERLVEHTPLKRDLYSMFDQPWSFLRTAQAAL